MPDFPLLPPHRPHSPLSPSIFLSSEVFGDASERRKQSHHLREHSSHLFSDGFRSEPAAGGQHEVNHPLYHARMQYGSENSVLPRNLGRVQIASLMINTMIGSGILTTPGSVLLSARSKTVAILLWAVGGVYTVLL